MRMSKLHPLAFTGLLAAAAVSAAAFAAIVSVTASAQESHSVAERYTATAMDLNRGSAGHIDLTVNRWSTDAQRDALLAVLERKGADKLLDALQDMPSVGHFGAPGQLSWDLRFARKTQDADGGVRIVLVTDRPINFFEAANQPRSITYPFTVIELRLDRDGNGEGKMSTATKIVADKKHGTITLENYELQPVQLTHVTRDTSEN